MFRRVTNLDVLNKILELENKIDILNTKLSSQDMCNCKVKELTIYKEIKSYFETKFESVLQNIKEIENRDELNESKLNYILRHCKTDIISSFENIISNLELINDKTEKKDKIEEYFIKISNKIEETIKNNNKSQINNLHTLIKSDNNVMKINEVLKEVNKTIQDILVRLNETYNKIDLLYYENETIKHQFLLEEDIRKYEFEIDNLKSLIKTTISDIDKILM